jgi:hypothetical protein
VLCDVSGLKHLRKLNLNSTSLSALTFEGLKVSEVKLPINFKGNQKKKGKRSVL